MLNLIKGQQHVRMFSSGQCVEDRLPTPLADVLLINCPGFRVSEAAMHCKVATFAQRILADVVAERFAVIFRVACDLALGLTAGLANRRHGAPAGSKLTLKPSKGLHADLVVKSVVGF